MLTQSGERTKTGPGPTPTHWGYPSICPSGPGWGHRVKPCGLNGEAGRRRGLGQEKKQPPCFPVLHRLTSQEPPVTTSPKATPELNSTHSPRSPGPPPGNSSTTPCRPEIHQSPAPGGLELLCEAACGPGMSASWTQAPGGLEAYERQEAGALARLSVLWARCNPEGWFQCRLDPGGQMASLYLVPEICEFWGLGRGLGEPQREESLASRP